MWVRSYYRHDIVQHLEKGDQVTTLGSNSGAVFLSHGKRLRNWDQRGWYIESLDLLYIYFPVDNSPGSFLWQVSREGWAIKAPYWFITPLMAANVIVPWIKWRFSLRTMLIVMALAAVALGIIAALAR